MIDLHAHTTASDGSLSPADLVAKALEVGLSALAVTDHDTLDGIPGAIERARGTPLRLVPGVEIEIEHEEGEFHLLGLCLDGDRAPLEEALRQVRASRAQRNARMVQAMRGDGIDISLEDLAAVAGGGVVSRAHFARLLVQRGVTPSVDAAFATLIGKGCRYWVPRACLSLEDAAALVRAAGGCAVAAHPVSLGLKGTALRERLLAWKARGLDGLEAWHPSHRLKDSRRFARLARSLGLAVTGGSDFHGAHVPWRVLGRTCGGREVPDALLDSLPCALRAARG